MDLNYTAEELSFRDEVRAFVRGNLPQDLARKVLEHRRLHKEDMMRWQERFLKNSNFLRKNMVLNFS